MAKYRLYIDESGTHNYSKSNDVDKRYLGLLGIFVEESVYELDLQPRIQKIKRLFSDDPDELPILHHEDIMDKSGAFVLLNNQEVRDEFNRQLLDAYKSIDYVICSVVIDKKEHLNKYNESAEHPYHYCLVSMLERYTHFLEPRGKGDVMAESRDKQEDLALKGAYKHFYEFGTQFRTKNFVQQYLSSSEIKIKPKSKGIAGLEFADLLALASKIDVLHEFGVLRELSDNFNKKIIETIQPKYCKGNLNGKVKGYGKKFL